MVEGAGYVADHHDEVGAQRLFQRRMKGLHQLVRQFADEAHRVHQQAFAFSGREMARITGSRVANSLSSTSTLAPERAFEQRGLAGVGVAHQRHHGLVLLFAARAAHVALALELRQAALPDRRCACARGGGPPPAASRRGRACRCRRPGGERLPQTHQPRQAVLHLRQLHLQLALGALRAGGKDVEDQRRAVDDAHAQRVFQIALLRAGQFVVEDGQIDLQRLTVKRQFRRLARADERAGVGPLPLLQTRG